MLLGPTQSISDNMSSYSPASRLVSVVSPRIAFGRQQSHWQAARGAFERWRDVLCCGCASPLDRRHVINTVIDDVIAPGL